MQHVLQTQFNPSENPYDFHMENSEMLHNLEVQSNSHTRKETVYYNTKNENVNSKFKNTKISKDTSKMGHSSILIQVPENHRYNTDNVHSEIIMSSKDRGHNLSFLSPLKYGKESKSKDEKMFRKRDSDETEKNLAYPKIDPLKNTIRQMPNTDNKFVRRTIKANRIPQRQLLSNSNHRTKRIKSSDVVKLVSVIVNPKVSYSALKSLLTSIGKTYPGMAVHILQSKNSDPIYQDDIRLVGHQILANESSGSIYNFLMHHVTTPYVLVATDLNKIDSKLNLVKLINVIENRGVWAVSGGIKSPNGQWRHGCLVSKFINFQASWKRGQLGRTEDCMLCDALEGPFLSSSLMLRELKWNKNLPSTAAHLDLFIRAYHFNQYSSASCSFALFHDSRPQPGINSVVRQDFVALGRQYIIHELRFPGDLGATLNCNEIPGNTCGKKGEIISPCCKEHLARIIRFFMQTCTVYNILCELQEGTLLGNITYS